MASDTKITWKTWQLPVGAIFISINSTNPATSFGYGTWELLDEGVFLKSTKTSSQLNTKAGSSTASTAHTHTVNSHTHSVSAHSHTVNSHSHSSAAHTHNLGSNSYAKVGRAAATLYTLSYTRGSVGANDTTYNRTLEFTSSVSSISGTNRPAVSGSTIGDVSALGGKTDSTTPGSTGSSSPGTNSAGGGNTGAASPGTSSAGGNITIDPPHIKVYMWKRTA